MTCTAQSHTCHSSLIFVEEAPAEVKCGPWRDCFCVWGFLAAAAAPAPRSCHFPPPPPLPPPPPASSTGSCIACSPKRPSISRAARAALFCSFDHFFPARPVGGALPSAASTDASVTRFLFSLVVAASAFMAPACEPSGGFPVLCFQASLPRALRCPLMQCDAV